MADTFVSFFRWEADESKRGGEHGTGGLGVGGALRGMGLWWQHNRPSSCDTCPCSYPFPWIVDGRNGARRKQRNEKIDHGNMAVLIGVRRPGRQQHQEEVALLHTKKLKIKNLGSKIRRPTLPRHA
jgi:hypothetical protein